MSRILRPPVTSQDISTSRFSTVLSSVAFLALLLDSLSFSLANSASKYNLHRYYGTKQDMKIIKRFHHDVDTSMYLIPMYHYISKAVATVVYLNCSILVLDIRREHDLKAIFKDLGKHK